MMPEPIKRTVCILAVALLTVNVAATEFESLPEEVQTKLNEGEICRLQSQPGAEGKVDKRFITMAKLMTGTRSEIWEVLIDKDNANEFLGGVLESKIVSRGEDEFTIDQRTKVGGPKGSYFYTLKYQLDSEKKVTFSFIKGDIKNVAGAWWIFEGPKPNIHLVVYSLHIDPGKFAPQFIVQSGIKKSMPETILSTESEIVRRRAAGEPLGE